VNAYVYVDGFNLYYGAFGRERGWPSGSYKWLDLAALAAHVWPALAPVAQVRYFTALVKSPASDPKMALRQQIYLRALRAVGVDVHLGTFKLRRKTVRLAGLPPQLPPYTASIVLSAEAEIGKYDEKGSDVNLATYLVRDAAKGEYAKAIVVSNDSDLLEPIRVVRRDFGVAVYLINPQRRAVAEMTRAANAGRDLNLATLAACQLPAVLKDAAGAITRPGGW
jgi:NYN domain-containing protein